MSTFHAIVWLDRSEAHVIMIDKEIAKAIVGVVTSDHPSDGQLVAMAREHFLKYDRMQSQT